MKKILAIGAHPDDLEFGCGGILVKEAQKGNDIKMLVFTKGEAGTSGTPEVREQESRKAAAIIGASIDFIDFGGDCHTEYNNENCIAIAKIIREYKPDIILIPTLNENQHPDHWKAAKITRDAARFARYGGLQELISLPTHTVSSIYQYRITTSIEKRPEVVIDVSDVFDIWMKVMECHETQLKNKSYIDFQTTHTKYLGFEAGCEHAMGLFLHDPLLIDSLSDISQSARNF